jgi:DNA-binding response OmpR family regulator
MAQVLLVGKDWKARALLRAQLLEEGLEVEACEQASEAIESLDRNELLPELLIADLSASDDPAGEAELLAPWARQVPIWVITSRSLIVDKKLKGRGFAMLLFRPIDLGELVEQIKQRLEKP